MNGITVTIDGRIIQTTEGTTVLRAAQEAGIYIPALCAHPDLVPGGYCGLCVVEVDEEGDVQACKTEVHDGMVITTETPSVREGREQALEKILTEHPHACLDCWRKDRCKPFDICLRSEAVSQHCVTCPKNGHCELQKVVDYIGIEPEIPYRPKEYPLEIDNPFFLRDYNLCIVCGRCVRVCRDVRGVGVYTFDDEENPTKILTVEGGSTVDSGCRFCFACVEVCPTGALIERDVEKLRENREGYIVPCSDACPAHVNIPRYVEYVRQGKYTEALSVIREKVPFPGSLGRVCFHPCEQACRRETVNDPISVKELKRVAADHGEDKWKEKSAIKESTGKRIAVVGAGPAGLTGAFYLAKAGHSVTVYEELPEAGGMMRYGIPEYRLPRDILAGEVQSIKDAGVEILTNTKIESINSLKEQGFDTILLGIGAHEGTKLGVEGEDLPGVMDGASFLRDVNLGKKIKLGEKVAVLGGGNSAVDSARVALRTGAKSVTMIYRRTRAEMPAAEEEIEDALHEGIEINFLQNPTKFTKNGDGLDVECIRMELGEPDASGRRRPEPIKGSEFTVYYDAVIGALGQSPRVPEGFTIKIGRGNTLQVNSKTLQTSMEGVYAAGDATTGPASVIAAIAAGRQAAQSIDKYLGGSGEIDEELAPAEDMGKQLGKDEGFVDKTRIEPELITLEKRLAGFAEVKNALSKENACKEAGRCFRCDLRLTITPPMQPPVRKKASILMG
ncbi:MAG TPA: FAD-dependent oxidoreductase [Dehalococcoidia bacterium]|nr:FAD-dependent oxidoreductase [Dehalococcoidia bacterium]